MKQIVVSACLLLTLVCGIPDSGLAQRRSASRRKQRAANRPPQINEFILSSKSAIIPCPHQGVISADLACNPPGRLKLKLWTFASDPDEDKLVYKYKVTAGRVIGKGKTVFWDLVGVAPGSYAVEVFVKDRRGGKVSKSASVDVGECVTCPLPCASISLSCPEVVDEGDRLVVSLNVSGGDPNINPTFKWSVSAGKIVKGQRTYVIEVDTTALAGQRLKVSVEVGGYPVECDKIESCEVPIRKR